MNKASIYGGLLSILLLLGFVGVRFYIMRQTSFEEVVWGATYSEYVDDKYYVYDLSQSSRGKIISARYKPLSGGEEDKISLQFLNEAGSVLFELKDKSLKAGVTSYTHTVSGIQTNGVFLFGGKDIRGARKLLLEPPGECNISNIEIQIVYQKAF